MFFFSSRRRHTRLQGDWSSDVCSSDLDLTDLVRRFHDAHQRRYGHMAQAEAVEIVNFQVTAVGLIPKPAMKKFDAADAEARPHETRQAYFNAGDARDVPVFRRSTLQPGMRLEGPAI